MLFHTLPPDTMSLGTNMDIGGYYMDIVIYGYRWMLMDITWIYMDVVIFKVHSRESQIFPQSFFKDRLIINNKSLARGSQIACCLHSLFLIISFFYRSKGLLIVSNRKWLLE